jgi:hypothetical protein
MRNLPSHTAMSSFSSPSPSSPSPNCVLLAAVESAARYAAWNWLRSLLLLLLLPSDRVERPPVPFPSNPSVLITFVAALKALFRAASAGSSPLPSAMAVVLLLLDAASSEGSSPERMMRLKGGNCRPSEKPYWVVVVVWCVCVVVVGGEKASVL